jgi:hypothetical protein
MGEDGQHSALTALPPARRHGIHGSGGWMEPEAILDRRRKHASPLEFDRRAIQCIESHYTNFAIPAH